MNRGIAQRPVFENRRCIRFFLSLVARAARAGRIEVHAFSVMTNHYHLMVRSLDGRISATMQRIQNEYVRWFNATHDRDGPLFRGRFRSRHVVSETYRRVLVRYIDENACAAGLVVFPAQYPHSSAHSYVRHSGPRWLTRTFVEGVVSELTGRTFSPDGYSQVFARRLEPEVSAQLVRAIEVGTGGQEGWETTLQSTASQVHRWLRECARTADEGTSAGAFCVPARLASALSRAKPAKVDADLEMKEIHAALLVDTCGLSQSEAGRALNESRWFVSRACLAHRARLIASEEYAGVCSRILHEALVEGHVAVAVGVLSRVG